MELHEASYYKKLKEKVVQCTLCPRYCTIKDGEKGNCGIRENKSGKLYALTYGKPCSANLDPIEKKPFYHFLPGQDAFSIATAGCNLHCMYCQNWQIAQCKPEAVPSFELPPAKVIAETKRLKSKIISYTYTEPTIFYEYMIDAAKLAKKKKIRNTVVSNGFINQEPLKELCKYVDAVNIDLKGNDVFYRKIADARLQPILDALLLYKKKKVWIEITNLIVPTLNDKISDFLWIASWIKDNLGVDVPLHFSAFYPMYKLAHLPQTSLESLKKARELALKAGLQYVYTGNLPDDEGGTTYCPECKKPLIKRSGFYVTENKIEAGKCIFCNAKIAGIWK